MKAAKLREMSDMDLDSKLDDTRRELFNLRFQITAGQLENTHRLTGLRKDLARILTIREERKLTPQEQELLRKQKASKKKEEPKEIKAKAKDRAKIKAETKTKPKKAVKIATGAKKKKDTEEAKTIKQTKKPAKKTEGK